MTDFTLTDIQIDSLEKLKSRVYGATGYEDNEDSLPEERLESIIQDAMLMVYLSTQSQAWFSDTGLGLALYAYVCMRAKASVENIAIDSYTFGGESVSIRNATAEDSQQIQQWMDDVRVGLSASEVDSNPRMKMENTTSYIGENYVHTGHRHER